MIAAVALCCSAPVAAFGASQEPATTAPAVAPSAGQGEPTTQAVELLAVGRAAEAHDLLRVHEARRAGDPEFDYLLGLAAAQAGRPRAALAPLRRALEVEPRFDGARLELARALAAAGDVDAARREYVAVAQRSPSPVARDAAARGLATLAGAAPRRDWRFVPAALAGAGYDSNANASTSGEVFGFVLDPRALEQSSPFVEVGASLAGESVAAGRGRLALQLRAGHRAHPDAHFVDQSAIDAGVGYSLRLGAWTAGVGATVAGGWLDAASWFHSAWLEAALSRPVGRHWELVGAGRAIALDYRQSRFEPLDAQRYVWGAALQSRRRAGSVPLYGIGVIGGRDATRDAGSPWSNDRYGARLFGAWPLDARRSVFAEVSWLTSDFFGARGFLGVDRLDRQVVAAAGFESRGWPARGWRIAPQLRWTDNRSNVTLFRFDRLEASVFVRREFD